MSDKARVYQKEFRELLQAVFRKQAHFRELFGGELLALDGVSNSETAFYVKTSDIPVVIRTEYDTSPNVGFGDGTGNSSRFGPRTEIVYADIPVPYAWSWSFHEGIDRHTVNMDLNAAVADRLELQAIAKTELFDRKAAEFISNNAGKTLEIAAITPESVLKLFNDLFKEFTNLETVGSRIAYVTPELYNAIIDHQLVTNAKASAVNIDDNEIIRFKSFRVKPVPEHKFQPNEIAYVSIEGIARQFTGINTARTIESEDFDGVALQGSGKAGEFILEANKQALIKVVLTPEIPEG